MKNADYCFKAGNLLRAIAAASAACAPEPDLVSPRRTAAVVDFQC
jgi:hypothetical protein